MAHASDTTLPAFLMTVGEQADIVAGLNSLYGVAPRPELLTLMARVDALGGAPYDMEARFPFDSYLADMNTHARNMGIAEATAGEARALRARRPVLDARAAARALPSLRAEPF